MRRERREAGESEEREKEGRRMFETVMEEGRCAVNKAVPWSTAEWSAEDRLVEERVRGGELRSHTAHRSRRCVVVVLCIGACVCIYDGVGSGLRGSDDELTVECGRCLRGQPLCFLTGRTSVPSSHSFGQQRQS